MSGLSTKTVRNIRIAFALLPFLLGFAAICLFFFNLSCNSLGTINPFNTCTWHIHSQTYSNLSLILIAGMISHNIIIAIGSILFLWDLFSFNRHTKDIKTGNMFLSIAAILIFFVSFGVQIVMTLWMTSSHQILELFPGLLSVPDDGGMPFRGVLYDLRFVEITDYMIISLFAVFLISDVLFLFGCRAIHEHDSCDAKSREKARRKRSYLFALIFLVDIPVLIGTTTVAFTISRLHTINDSPGEFGSRVTDISEMGRNGLIEHNIIGHAGRGETIEARSDRRDKVAYINTQMLENYLLGLLAGALFFQVLYSQIVLLILNVREVIRDSRTKLIAHTT